MRISVCRIAVIFLVLGCEGRAVVKEYNRGLDVSFRENDCGPYTQMAGLRCTGVKWRFISHRKVKLPRKPPISVSGVAVVFWENETDKEISAKCALLCKDEHGLIITGDVKTVSILPGVDNDSVFFDLEIDDIGAANLVTAIHIKCVPPSTK